jgi:hypothetical protein
MRRYDVVREICDYMLDLGWGPYQNDHEDANGQFEMNWEFDDALATADKHSFFKFMVKSVAEKHGLRATFMPKPVEGLTGNGCHTHVSVWDAPGDAAKTNVFAIDPTPGSATSELGLSDQGRAFLGGIMKHASGHGGDHQPHGQQLQALNAPVTLSGATWAPNTVTWTGQQPHPHGPRAGAGAVRIAPARWRGEPLPAAGGDHRGGPRRHGQRRRSRQAPRHRHVCRGPQGARRGETAAQHARRAQGL